MDMGSRTSALRAWALAMLALVVALVVGTGSAAAQGTTRRIAGPDRYSTMEALVREGFQSSGWAVVATAEGFPDALAASPVAGARQAPLILTASSQLSPQARSLVSSLGVRNALIMGGEGAVSAEVEATLSSLGVSCERIAGADRAQTSVAAYDATRAAGSVSDTVIVTTGANYADALAIGPWAWRSASPILLAGASGTLGDEAVAKVKEDALVKRVILVGGTSVVSDAVRGQLGDAYEYVRLAGADRYLTAAEVARWSCGNGLSWSNVAVATGTGFADALAAAPTLGRSATPLLLASDAACSLIREKASAIDTCLLLGGTAAVSDAQERAVADALAGTSKGSSATTNTGGARTESDSGWYYSGSSHSRGKYAGEIYGPGYVEPQPQPQPQPEPEPADDDGYEGDTTPEAWGDFYLWPDEEDVLIPGGNVSAIVRTTSYERPNDPIYAQAEEADMPVARTEQTFYLEAPKGTVVPTLHVRNADGTERALGQMMPVSDLEVKALNDEYAGNTTEDTGDEYIGLAYN